MSRSSLESLFVIPSNDNQTTFGNDNNLPSLPLPDLRHTLTRYLDSLRPFLTPEELAKSIQLVKSFESGIGKVLHEHLAEKSKKERNWVEKWWEEYAYLKVRLPLIPYCSMDGVFLKSVCGWLYGSEEDQIRNAAIYAHYLTQYWKLIRIERLLPTQTADKKVNFSMSQYRRLFNTVRRPGKETDSLATYFKTASEGFCPTTVILICRGRLFCVNAVDEKSNPMTPPEWEEILRRILNICKKSPYGQCLGILTCDERTNWSKNRKHLESISKKNQEILELIDKSMFVLVLDDASPETDSDVSNCNLCGDYNNRWCDKSFGAIFYKNGRSGTLCDHTAFDGIIVIACHHFIVTAIEESRNGGVSEQIRSNMLKFEELKFDVDEMVMAEVERLQKETILHKKEILMARQTFEDYGKVEIQRLKFHPDSYVQMCLQLAYFCFHHKPGACYETATTRKYYNGRTETVRCCTMECLDWVRSMINPISGIEERKTLFERAIKRHDELMSEARDNAGCDRHLFGMYCLALEEGIEIPDLYLDPAYLKSGGGGNFVLSTSCVGYTFLGGGVAPMCRNGYGIFYHITANRIFFTLSVNTRSDETNAELFFDSLKNALRQTRQTLLLSGRDRSKF